MSVFDEILPTAGLVDETPNDFRGSLSPQQEAALRAVFDWIHDPHGGQVFKLFGYAGTGKSTLAKLIAENVGGGVVFAAYTGKAASVMRRKGCSGASTIHALIYRCEKVHTAQCLAEQHALDKGECPAPCKCKLLCTLNSDSVLCERGTKLLIVDESSMVGERLGRDLLSFDTKRTHFMIPYQLAEQKNDPILRARLAKQAYSAIAQRLNKLDPKSHGYDHWVLEEELGKYFDEVNLEIQWLD